MNNRILALGISAAVLFTFMAQDARCDVIGDTYTIGATIFPDTGGGFFADDGPAGATFDGTTKTFGNLVFGDAGDVLVIQESQTVAADGITFTVDVFAFGQDAAGDFTTWVADGTVTDDGAGNDVPFTLSFFGLAAGNGGADTLDVDTAGFTYNFVSSEALLVAFDEAAPATATIFTFGDGPTAASGPSGQLAATVGFSSAPDLAGPVAALGDLAVAGYGFTWTYTLTPVPEPGSAVGLLLLGFAGFSRRKRQLS